VELSLILPTSRATRAVGVHYVAAGQESHSRRPKSTHAGVLLRLFSVSAAPLERAVPGTIHARARARDYVRGPTSSTVALGVRRQPQEPG
jgi:hypothetical protein